MANSAAQTCLEIGQAWLDAFNAQDVAALVDLYGDDATHTSPKIRALHPETDGKLRGKAALHAWWSDSNARIPGLRYVAVSFTANAERVFVEYTRYASGQAPSQVAEVFEISDGKIVASRVYHG